MDCQDNCHHMDGLITFLCPVVENLAVICIHNTKRRHNPNRLYGIQSKYSVDTLRCLRYWEFLLLDHTTSLSADATSLSQIPAILIPSMLKTAIAFVVCSGSYLSLKFQRLLRRVFVCTTLQVRIH